MSFPNYKHPNRAGLAKVMIIVTAVLVYVIYLQVRDRFSDPEITTTEQAERSTTGKAAQNAGARLSPTDPKLAVRPEEPKTYQPADHPAPERVPM